MKVLVFFSFLLIAFLQVQARSIGAPSGDVPEVILENFQQGMACGQEFTENHGREEGAKLAATLRDTDFRSLLPEDNKYLNAVWGCVFEKKGIIDKNSQVDQDQIENYLRRIFAIGGMTSSEDLRIAHDIAEVCAKEKGDDYGQTAIKINNCFEKENLKMP